VEEVLRVVSIMACVLSLTAIFLCTPNTEINEQAIAQRVQNPFPNNTETAEQLANIIEGNDTAIIMNDTAISNLNDTLLNSIGINIREDCMRLPNSTVLYCP
jgi:hypothetical protein